MSKESAKTRSDQLAVAARHAAGIGVGWFTLTLLARQLMDAANSGKTDEYHDKLRSYVDARYPTFTPNLHPSLREEKLLANAGTEHVQPLEDLESKTAKDEDTKGSSFVRKITDKFLNPIPVGPGPVTSGSLVGAFGSTGIHPAHIALTLAAAIAGTGAGMAVSNKLSNKAEERKLDERIAKAQVEMDKLMAAEYRRTRGLDKTAKDKDTFLEKGVSGVTKLYLLYAAGVAALSYGISKHYMDENDPNRARMGALQELAKDRARMSGAPQILEDPSDPTYSKLNS